MLLVRVLLAPPPPPAAGSATASPAGSNAQLLPRTGSFTNISVDAHSAAEEPIADDRPPREAYLILRVIKASNLPVNADVTYVTAAVETQKFKTKVAKKTLNPEWSESFESRLRNANTAVLRLSIKNHQQFGRNSPLCDASVRVEALPLGVDHEIALKPQGALIVHVDLQEIVKESVAV